MREGTLYKYLFQGSFFGYILPVLAFSVLYNGPKFFEFTTEYRLNENRLVQNSKFRKTSQNQEGYVNPCGDMWC